MEVSSFGSCLKYLVFVLILKVREEGPPKAGAQAKDVDSLADKESKDKEKKDGKEQIPLLSPSLSPLTVTTRRRRSK